ncbi:NAD-dependent epimerase/dehydratase family protein [Variovorax sp. tm]|uniref:NAD-dependent epimerase/dehydratase family protein n=1 Tax=Variovorax atrisoli TaxID=3394203 RepID=UPI003A80A10F
MKVLIFGATGMVGQGVLRECLLAPDVESVVAIGRNPTGQQHPKLRDLVHRNMYDYGDVESQLQGFDACFFCLGVSSVGMKEPEYRHITYDLTLAAATVLARLNPGMTFTYVTGAGTDSSERGSSMWARVKGATENALLRLPFKAAYMFRPGMIQPLHGIRSKTPVYDVAIVVLKPVLGLAFRLWPNRVTTTENVGRAMLAVARNGAPKPILDPADINALG